VHGTIDRANADRESFVITEDQYIEYLSEEPMEKLLPPRLLQKMREKHHLLFLGYSLHDWNFRVFLRRLKREQLVGTVLPDMLRRELAYKGLLTDSVNLSWRLLTWIELN